MAIFCHFCVTQYVRHVAVSLRRSFDASHSAVLISCFTKTHIKFRKYSSAITEIMEGTPLKRVILNADVYAICLQHALSTEKEEVMGLLIGNVDEASGISHISACTILRRIDKQPDRVEISSDQLLNASMYAEGLSNRLQRPLRVIGWYHSHPHITVWPSHVDVRTQELYQMMDKFFVGLIFSVYPKNAGSCDNQVQMTAFQSKKENGELQRQEIWIEVANSPLEDYNLEALATLPKILVQEEMENHEGDVDLDGDPLISLHNNAFKTLKHVHILSKITRPLCDDLEARLKATNARIRELEEIKLRLLEGEFA